MLKNMEAALICQSYELATVIFEQQHNGFPYSYKSSAGIIS